MDLTKLADQFPADEIGILPLAGGGHALVDLEDLPRLVLHRWRKKPNGYAYREEQRDYKRSCIYLHRYLIDAPKGKDVDHINMNKLDNRKVNLRLATRSLNNGNRKQYKNSISPYKGVYQSPSLKWYSRISYQGVQHNLGTFANPEDAAKAYNTAAVKLFGSFSNLVQLP